VLHDSACTIDNTGCSPTADACNRRSRLFAAARGSGVATADKIEARARVVLETRRSSHGQPGHRGANAPAHAFRSSAFGWSITFGRPADNMRRRVGASAASRNVCRADAPRLGGHEAKRWIRRTVPPAEVVFGDRFWGQVQGFSGSFRALGGRVAPSRRSAHAPSAPAQSPGIGA
jgi:hypothetical protein